jgi:UDP-N-acetylmuramoyl-L-alanyl-D-glutamate--2,6-diaminopimelate ligase
LLQNRYAKINIKKAIQILTEKNLLSYISNSIHQISNDCEVRIFYHSRDVEDFLNSSSIVPFIQSPIPNFIYIARSGKTFDGHFLAEKVLHSKNIFIGNINRTQENIDNIDLLKQNYFIGVKNLEEALNSLLKEAYGLDLSTFTFIGVTGTNGKTSVVQISGQMLESLYKNHVLKIGTLGMEIGDQKLAGSHVTTPDFSAFISILDSAHKQNVNKVVMEITSHGLKENRLADLKIDVGVFTNLTQDHIDFHGSMEDYRLSKEKLFTCLLSENGTAIININNQEYPHFIKAASGQKRSLILVGDANSFCSISKDFFTQFASIRYLELSVEHQKADLTGISGDLSFKSQNGEILEQHSYKCPLLGEFQQENVLCAIGIILALGFSLENACRVLNHIKNIPGRLELIKSTYGEGIASKKSLPNVIIDYAHTPDALEKSILACKKLLSSNGKIITVFGCGGDRDPSKRAMMGKIASQLSDFVIVTSDNPRKEDPDKIIHDIFMGIDKKRHCKKQKDRKNAIIDAIKNANGNDLVLVAGKGHENYQIIGEIKYPFSDENIVQKILDGESF